MADAYRGNLNDITPKTRLFGFYRGTVVDVNDPLQRGRARIRIFGIHTQLIQKQVTEGIPDKELPWAEQVAPAMGGTSGNGFFGAPTCGTIVWCFFANGDPLFPMYFGVQFGATVITDGTGSLPGNNPAQPAASDAAQGNGESGNTDGPVANNSSNAKGICDVAARRNIDPCTVQAISVVESGGGSGILKNGKPVIRFESHWFAKRIDSGTKAQLAGNKELVSNSWKESIKYKGGWSTYEKAAAINPNAAFDSTSWGKYQIMGDYWNKLGYSSRDEMKAAASDPNRQEEILDRFLNMKDKETRGAISKALSNNDFATIAKYYNGSGNVATYSSKINNAYNACKKNPPNCSAGEGSSSSEGTPATSSINVQVI